MIGNSRIAEDDEILCGTLPKPGVILPGVLYNITCSESRNMGNYVKIVTGHPDNKLAFAEVKVYSDQSPFYENCGQLTGKFLIFLNFLKLTIFIDNNGIKWICTFVSKKGQRAQSIQLDLIPEYFASSTEF